MDTFSLPKIHTLLRSLSSHLLSFLCHESLLRNRIKFNCYISLDSSWLWQFLRLSLFWWPWQFWGILITYFVECLSIGVRLMTFSWLDWVIFLRGHSSKVPFSSTQIFRCHEYILSIWFITVDFDFSCLAEVMFAFSRMSYNWNHIVHSIFTLASFT